MSSNFGRVFRCTEIISIESLMWHSWDGIELLIAIRTPWFTLSLRSIVWDVSKILLLNTVLFSHVSVTQIMSKFLVYTTDWNWLNLFIKLHAFHKSNELRLHSHCFGSLVLVDDCKEGLSVSTIIMMSDNDEKCIMSLGPASDWLGGCGSAVSAPDNIVLAAGIVGNWYWLLGDSWAIE